MKSLAKFALATAIGASFALGTTSLWAADAAPAPAAAPAEHVAKNWTPPAFKTRAQALADEIMAKHPELISVTFHGTPPNAAPKTYTMFAGASMFPGSYQDRIGNPDDPDDIMIIETGITILDPRWHRTKDVVRKYVPMMPLRDAAGENIGLLVMAFKNPANSGKDDMYFFKAATKLRDDLQKKIPSFTGLFDPAK